MKNVKFDPRTKILCILLTVICAAFYPSLRWEAALIMFIMVFGLLCGQVKTSICWSVTFGAMYGLWSLYLNHSSGLGHTTVIAWLILIFKLFPCCMVSSIVLKSTQINEFMTAMNKIHAPKALVIAMAVLIRYLPTVREDWGCIKDAMLLRGVSPSLKSLITQPVTTIECLYVPLLITASKTADELTIASVTRGIESPNTRSSMMTICFRWFDYAAVALFVIAAVTMILL